MICPSRLVTFFGEKMSLITPVVFIAHDRETQSKGDRYKMEARMPNFILLSISYNPKKL
jgi:hypothetical protein